jgi:hypothetical protein
VSNRGALVSGWADFFVWGLEDADDHLEANDIRAVGVQTFEDPIATDPDRRQVVFGINTWRPWDAGSLYRFEVLIDVDLDGIDDYLLVAADSSAFSAPFMGLRGVLRTAMWSLRSPRGFFTTGTFSSTDTAFIQLGVLTSRLCFSNEPCLSKAANPRLSYTVRSYAWNRPGSQDTIAGRALFNVWNGAITSGQFVQVAPSTQISVDPPVSIDAQEWPRSTPLGLMVVSPDNRNGREEAQLIPIKFK